MRARPALWGEDERREGVWGMDGGLFAEPLRSCEREKHPGRVALRTHARTSKERGPFEAAQRALSMRDRSQVQRSGGAPTKSNASERGRPACLEMRVKRNRSLISDNVSNQPTEQNQKKGHVWPVRFASSGFVVQNWSVGISFVLRIDMSGLFHKLGVMVRVC